MRIRYALPLLLFTASLAANAQGQFVIKGTMLSDSLCYSKGTVRKVYLTHEVNSQEVVVDSAYVTNKQFAFKGTAPAVMTPYAITGFDNGAVQVFLEPGDIVIQPFSAKFPAQAKVKGTPANNTFFEYQELSEQMNRKGRERMDSVKAGLSLAILANKMAVQSFQKSVISANNFALQAATMRFVCQHLESPVSLYIMKNHLLQYFKPDIIEEQLFNAVPADTRKHPMYKQLLNIVRSGNMQIGKPAPDVEGQTPDGKTVSLSQLRGKYVLLDFWASWCGPCRREMPNVKALYDKYHAQGFDVVGVSFDSDKAPWLNAIKKMNLPWHNISDLKGWKSKAAALYGINSIPSTLLIDPQGKIIATDLHGEELETQLNTIYEKSDVASMPNK